MNESAVSKICKLHRVIKRSIDKLANNTDVNGAEGRAIHFLIENEDKDIFQKDVELEFDLRPSTASEFLKRMEAKGFIKRESVKSDARLKKLVVTDKARKHEKYVFDKIAKFDELAIEGLTKEELEIFDKVTDVIMSNLKNQDC